MTAAIVVLTSSFRRPVWRNDVDFGAGYAAAHHLAHFKPRAYIQRFSGPCKGLKRDAGIHQCAQQHVAANPRETFQISNSHYVVILNGERLQLHFRRLSLAPPGAPGPYLRSWDSTTQMIEGSKTESGAAASQNFDRQNRIQRPGAESCRIERYILIAHMFERRRDAIEHLHRQCTR